VSLPARRSRGTILDVLAREWWVALIAVPFGFGIWAAFLYIGVRLARWRWLVCAPLYLGLAVGSYVLLTTPIRDLGPLSWAWAGVSPLVLWVVGAAHALHARREFVYRLRLRQIAADVTVERRVAADLARRQPRLARTVGMGRPDLPGAQHANLVDVNSAPASVIARLPGIDDTLARQIVELRPYDSVEDVGALLELPAPVVEELRERTIFVRV
jgi:Helix-hairpin-helix motif